MVAIFGSVFIIAPHSFMHSAWMAFTFVVCSAESFRLAQSLSEAIMQLCAGCAIAAAGLGEGAIFVGVVWACAPNMPMHRAAAVIKCFIGLRVGLFEPYHEGCTKFQ